jgi:hypothetical protein
MALDDFGSEQSGPQLCPSLVARQDQDRPRRHSQNSLSPIERPSQCHHAVTHNLAKLTDKLFIAGTTVPGLASNCSTLELLNVRNADRLSARDALRFDRELRAMPGA